MCNRKFSEEQQREKQLAIGEECRKCAEDEQVKSQSWCFHSHSCVILADEEGIIYEDESILSAEDELKMNQSCQQESILSA